MPEPCDSLHRHSDTNSYHPPYQEAAVAVIARFVPVKFPLGIPERNSGTYGVMRLRLGRRLVYLLPLAQRTKTLTMALTQIRAHEERGADIYVHRAVTARGPLKTRGEIVHTSHRNEKSNDICPNVRIPTDKC